MNHPLALTREQIDWTQSVFHTWLTIRRQANQVPSIDNTASFTKSCLLARLLAGKDPLPDPPPTFAAAPWYELIEEGFAVLSPEFVHTRPIGRWSIGGWPNWFEVWGGVGRVILDRLHGWTGEPMGERWLLNFPVANSVDPDDALYRLQRIEGALRERLALQEIPADALEARTGQMTGCALCGVGPEDECTMDCPSRDNSRDE